MTEEQKQLYKLFSAAHVAHVRRATNNDERMISLMKLIQSQIELISGHIEIDGLPEIQAEFRSVLARVESGHETDFAEIEGFQDVLDSL